MICFSAIHYICGYFACAVSVRWNGRVEDWRLMFPRRAKGSLSSEIVSTTIG